VKLAPFGRRSRAAAHETSGLSPLQVALHPALEDGRWSIPDRFNFTRDVVEVLAEDPKRQALMHLGAEGVIEPRTFHQLAESASQWAARFRAHEIRHGDRVLVLVAGKLQWIEVMLAGIKTGVVTVPCPQSLSAAALDIRIASTGAKLVVASRAAAVEHLESADRPAVLYVEDQDELPIRHFGEEPSADTSTRDLAFVLSTSGTAYGPHGVTHTHAAVFAARAEAENWLDAGPEDVVWCTSDTGSALTVWNVLVGPWSRGAEVVCHDGPFDPVERLDLIRRLDVTVLCQSPVEYHGLAELGDEVLRRHRPEALRRLVATGDALSPDVVAVFEDAWELTIHDGYGQVECGTVVGFCGDTAPRPGSIGLPLPGHDVVVVDANGNELPPGAEGDLVVRGASPVLFSGYWQAPDETKAAFRGEMYVTGDIATRDDDGYIHLLGRAQDVITSGGNRFSPAEIEDALRAYHVVEDAGVVGSRDLERGGQFVRAFVVLRPEVQGSDRLVAEIRQHLRKSLPESRVPREVEFVDELPRTPNGKLRRLELRERPVARSQPAWTEEQRRPWKPQPEIAPEPEPLVAEPPEEDEEEDLLPDYVVPRSQTLAARLESEPPLETEPEPEDAALPDYIVQEALDPDELLPNHVVSFLKSEPLTDIEHPPQIASPRTGLPKLNPPEGKFETRPEPTLDPRPQALPEQHLEPIVFTPPEDNVPKPDDPLAPPKKPTYTVIPRPIEEPKPYGKRVFEPLEIPKTEPRLTQDKKPAAKPVPAPRQEAAPQTPAEQVKAQQQPTEPKPSVPAPDTPAPATLAQATPAPATPAPATPAPATPAPKPRQAPKPKPAARVAPKPPPKPAPRPAPPKVEAPEPVAKPEPQAPAASKPKPTPKPAPKPAAKAVPKPPPKPAARPAPPKAETPRPAPPKPAAPKPAAPKPEPAKPAAAKPAPATPAPAKPAAAKRAPAPRPKPVPKATPKPPPARPAPPPPAPEPERIAASAAPAPAVEEAPKKGRLGRKKKAAEPVAEGKKRRVQKSAPEVGMEEQDVTFMHDLSSRLSAYSVDPDEPIAVPAPAPVQYDGDAALDQDLEDKPDYIK